MYFFHRPCAGITEAPPEEVDWFCPKCELQRRMEKANRRGTGRGRPRGRGRGRGKKK